MVDEMPVLPQATLLTGAVGCGKTEAAIDIILETRRLSAFGTIWVLLATGQQIHTFRDRLVARSDDQVQFGVEFFSFPELYNRLLDLAGDPQRQVDDTARYQILRHVIGRLRDRFELYGEIALKPGFIGLVAGLIHELKQSLVPPEQFAEVAARRGPKDRDLARIYTAYQEFLQGARLVDRHGAGWLAIEHLARRPQLAAQVELLVVDGFDQFNRVHIRLLNELAQQVKHTVLTLTHVSGVQGQRFRRFVQTRERLLKAAPRLWREQTVEGVCERPAAALDHLVKTVFDSRTPPIADDGTISLIEAPNIPREVQAVMRRIKRLLLDGVSPESVAVVARRLAPYSGVLRETARAYGVPLVVREGVPLRENPVVAMLLTLIDLARLDFPRREVLDTLRSPYLESPDLTPEMIGRLERISYAGQVVRGRAVWQEAVQAATIAWLDDEGEVAAALQPDEASLLGEALERHFDRITPPTHGTVYDLIGWIERLIGPDPGAALLDRAESVEVGTPPSEHFNVLGRIRATDDGDQQTRDLLAMGALRHILATLRAAYDLVDANGASPVIAWDDFRADLHLAVDRATVVPPGGLSRMGRVLATDVLEVRGLPHAHVFILGLSEGMFPAAESDDALYQESERRALEAEGIDMQTAEERSDDLSLFYQALGLARETLTISRYTVDDKGTPCPPSPYWAAVRAAVRIPDRHIERIAVGAVPRLDECATIDEAAVAVAAAFMGEEALETAFGVYNRLLDQAAWINVLRGRAVEARREDMDRAFDHYGGRLTDPRLIALAAQSLDSRRRWSATQLNDYGVCPFRFFARQLLHLEEVKEPEEGPDALQFGTINHRILEDTYRQLADEGLTIEPDNLPRALAILEEQAEAMFASAPRDYGFRPTPLWEQEWANMMRRLRWLVELDFSADSPIRALAPGEGRRPLWQEVTFGKFGQPPLILDGPAGRIWVSGQIDRIDIVGDQIVIVDYKSGSHERSLRDMAEGRDFQMILYLLAAQMLLERRGDDLRLAGGLFWHISSRKDSGRIHLEQDYDALEQALTRLHDHIQAARSGYFAVQPHRGRCHPNCEYGTLCRFSRAYTNKA